MRAKRRPPSKWTIVHIRITDFELPSDEDTRIFERIADPREAKEEIETNRRSDRRDFHSFSFSARARNLSSLGQEKINRTLRACKISPQYAVLFIRQLISITARRDGGQKDGWIASRARVYSHRNGVHLPQSSSSSSSPLPSRRGLHSRVLCISTYTRRAIPSLCCLLLLFHYPFHTRLSHSSSSHLPHRPTPSAPLPLVGGA